MPRCVSAGTVFPIERVRGRPYCAAALSSLLLKYQVEDHRSPPVSRASSIRQIDVRFKLVGFAQEDERRFGWIDKVTLFDPVEQP